MFGREGYQPRHGLRLHFKRVHRRVYRKICMSLAAHSLLSYDDALGYAPVPALDRCTPGLSTSCPGARSVHTYCLRTRKSNIVFFFFYLHVGLEARITESLDRVAMFLTFPTACYAFSDLPLSNVR